MWYDKFRTAQWVVTWVALAVALLVGLPALTDYLSRERDADLAARITSAEVAAERSPEHLVVILDNGSMDCDLEIPGVYRCKQRVGP